MKLIKLIYNPVSGNAVFPAQLDSCIKQLQQSGYLVNLYRSKAEESFANAFFDVDKLDYDAIVVAGGDGTVNKVINQIYKHNLNIPLGLLPTGTANDLAVHLGISNDLEKAINIITKAKSKEVDLGFLNNGVEKDLFINVCAGGLFADVAHETDREAKRTLGKLAYYLKGISEITSFETLPLKITTDEKIIKEDVSLFLILNGSSAGGFKYLAKTAKIDDGLFDFIAIKEAPLNELLLLLIKVLQGSHIEDENIIYCKSSYLKLEILDKTIDLEVDIDGEKGPRLPIEATIKPKVIKVFVE